MKQCNNLAVKQFNHFLQRVVLAVVFIILAGGFLAASKAEATTTL